MSQTPALDRSAGLDEVHSMATITLPRTNARPLAFEGRLITKMSSKALRGQLSLRWNEIAIYESNESFVLGVSYRSRIPSEQQEHVVVVCADMGEIAQELRTYGPGVHLSGEPNDVAEYLAQARVFSEVRAGYYRIVNELLAREDLGAETVHIEEE
jgi:hypothetical protein